MFEELEGKILTEVTGLEDGGDFVTFVTQQDEKYYMQHHQSCCEHVYIESVVGDVDDIIGHPILKAEEAVNPEESDADFSDSCTWTFYHIRTVMGSVTIRWVGVSNGYYSESVDFSTDRSRW